MGLLTRIQNATFSEENPVITEEKWLKKEQKEKVTGWQHLLPLLLKCPLFFLVA